MAEPTNPRLIERAVDRALELAAAAATSSDWDGPRAEAYGKATALASSALQAACVAAGGASPEHLAVVGQMSHCIQEMGHRLIALEQQQGVRHG